MHENTIVYAMEKRAAPKESDGLAHHRQAVSPINEKITVYDKRHENTIVYAMEKRAAPKESDGLAHRRQALFP